MMKSSRARKIARFRAAVFAAAFLVASAGLVAQTTGTAGAIASPDGSFSVNFPASCTPELKQEKTESADTELWSCTVPGQGFFGVVYAQYQSIASASAEVAANRDNFIKATQTTLVDQHDITTDGVSGIEFNARSADMNCRARVWVKGNRAFMAAVSAGGSSPISAADDSFLSSFHIAAK